MSEGGIDHVSKTHDLEGHHRNFPAMRLSSGCQGFPFLRYVQWILKWQVPKKNVDTIPYLSQNSCS